uniref:PDZ domain-containing protein n=1 Tax=Steinernema glaseri TaxID=37863 RepID=A0A1I7ZYK2_9BILA
MGAPHQAAVNGATNGVPLAQQRVPEIVKISFCKAKGGGIGLSIVAAQGVGDREMGIYVKNVLDGGAARRDGRIEIGDQLLSVNGQSLLGITQEQAAQKMAAAGLEVSFEVSKRAAHCNGLAAWLTDSPSTPALTAHSKRIEQPSTSVATGHDSKARKGSINSLGSAALPPPPQSQPPRFIPQQPPLYSNLSEIPKHNRSISASELYHQSDTASLNSFNSQARTYQPASQSHYHHLPAHYRQSSRPAVIQPERPNRTGMSPTPLSNGSIYGTVQRTSDDGYFNNSFSSTVSAGPKSSYASLPAVPPKPQMNVAQESKPVYAAPSGRRSAPLFERQVNQIESDAAAAMTREELDEELDRLESKGPDMTEADKRRYRALVDHIGKYHRPALPVSRSAIDFVQNGKDRKITGLERQAKSLSKMDESPQDSSESHAAAHPTQAQELPFLSEMESRLEAKRSSIGSSVARVSPPVNDAMIDDLNQQFESAASVSSPTLPRSSLSSLRDSPPSSTDERSKKRVNFAEHDDQESRTSSRQENTSPPGTSDMDGPKFIYRKNTEEEENEPRAITTGKQEVYRDPRQRLLDKQQAMSKKPQVDGTHLDFREKMRLFAKQLGEDTPKNRVKASSAQREIEDHLEAGQK